MTAMQIGDRVVDELKTLPWQDYYCAVTTMAGLVLELYRDLLTPQVSELCARSLALADAASTGRPVDRAAVAEVVEEWQAYQNTQTGHVHECIAGVWLLFDSLVRELDRNSAHYAARQYVTEVVLHYPTDGVLPPLPAGTLMPLTLDFPHAADSTQGRLLARFEHIIEKQRRYIELDAPRTPQILRQATEL